MLLNKTSFSHADNPPIAEVVQQGVIPKLVEFLRNPQLPQLQVRWLHVVEQNLAADNVNSVAVALRLAVCAAVLLTLSCVVILCPFLVRCCWKRVSNDRLASQG